MVIWIQCGVRFAWGGHPLYILGSTKAKGHFLICYEIMAYFKHILGTFKTYIQNQLSTFHLYLNKL
jgi:hypothetical protein